MCLITSAVKTCSFTKSLKGQTGFSAQVQPAALITCKQNLHDFRAELMIVATRAETTMMVSNLETLQKHFDLNSSEAGRASCKKLLNRRVVDEPTELDPQSTGAGSVVQPRSPSKSQ